MGISDISHVIEGVWESQGIPIAPHIAGLLLGDGALTVADALETAKSLSPEQLSGLVSIPFPCEPPRSFVSQFEQHFSAVDPAIRELLIYAAASATDRVAVILYASRSDARVLLSSQTRAYLGFVGGTFRFKSPAVRVAIINKLSDRHAKSCHTELSRAHMRYGYIDLARWHAAQAGILKAEKSWQRLVGYGWKLLYAGSSVSARRVAETVLIHDDPSMRSGATELLAWTALAHGNHLEAFNRFQEAIASADHTPTKRAQRGQFAAGELLNGMVNQTDAPRPKFPLSLSGLRAAVTTATDQLVVMGLVKAASHSRNDPTAADSLHARILMAKVPQRDPWSWSLDPGPMSPVIDAHVTGVTVDLLVQLAHYDAADSVLKACVGRLPLIQGAGQRIIRVVSALNGAGKQNSWMSISKVFGAMTPNVESRSPETGQYTSPLTMAVINGGSDVIRVNDRLEGLLTERENQITRLLARGYTNRDVAQAMNLSTRTVEKHLQNIYRKIGVQGRTALVSTVLR